jgi:hypothetical protein
VCGAEDFLLRGAGNLAAEALFAQGIFALLAALRLLYFRRSVAVRTALRSAGELPDAWLAIPCGAG